MAKTQYKLVSHDHIEKLLEELNTHGNDEWKVVGTIQEHGFTKILLEKEIP